MSELEGQELVVREGITEIEILEVRRSRAALSNTVVTSYMELF